MVNILEKKKSKTRKDYILLVLVMWPILYNH